MYFSPLPYREPLLLEPTVMGWRERWRVMRGRQSIEQRGVAILKSIEQHTNLPADQLARRIAEARYQTDDEALVTCALVMQQTLGKLPYLVQIIGALHLLDQRLIQLAPGEGKTLTIGLASAVLGFTGKPCHVLTANEYLAERDAEELEPYYATLGLSVAATPSEPNPLLKRQAYAADVVYSTAKQILADFLTDKIALGHLPTRRNMAVRAVADDCPALQQRGLYSCIVDEADSLLIDEATTPLIISGPEPNPLLTEGVLKAHSLIGDFVKGEHFRIARDPAGVT